MRDENRGPHPTLINQRHPPISTDMRQLREVVQTFSDAWGCDKLEDTDEDFDGNGMDGTTFRGRWIAWTIQRRLFQ